MKELFVPYKLAALAKKKGFDKPCLAFYNLFVVNNPELPIMQFQKFVKVGTCYWIKNSGSNTNSAPDEYVAAPLYQQLIDWLDSKEVFVEHELDLSNGLFEYYGKVSIIIDYDKKLRFKTDKYPTKLKSLNRALEEGLKLIP